MRVNDTFDEPAGRFVIATRRILACDSRKWIRCISRQPSRAIRLDSASTFQVPFSVDFGNTLGAGYYVIDTGPINLAGAQLIVNTATKPVISLGSVFTIIDNNTGTPVSGTFARLLEGIVRTINHVGYQVNYVGGSSGQNVTLTIVPPVVTTPTIAASTPNFSTKSMRPGLSVLGADTA